jgi:outer membrane receptor protein involved in Fe transport
MKHQAQLALCAFALTGPLASLAQTTPPPAAPTADAAPIQLSEFRVDTSKDKGYAATNTISGTRLNTPIKNLPLPIEVITDKFIEDIGALDVREALAYSSGVLLDSAFDNGGSTPTSQPTSFDFSPSNSGGNLSTTNDYKLRGFTTNVTLRNGFVTRGQLDSADIGRMEVVRGPAALLYGHSILGGTVNVLPKYPLGVPRYSFGATVGSNDLWRFNFDLTGPLFRLGGQSVNYRVPGSIMHRGDWTDHFETESKFLAPKIEFRPFRDTNVFFDFQFLDQKISGNGFQDISYPNLPRSEFDRQLGLARSLGNRDKKFRWSGPDTYEKTRARIALAEVTQKAGERLTFVASVQHQFRDVARRRITGQGVQTNNAGTPAALRTPLRAGAGFDAIRYEWNDDGLEVSTDSVRLEGNYRFDLNLPLLGASTHSLVLGRQDVKETNDTFGRGSAAPTVTATGALQFQNAFVWKRTDDFSLFRYEGQPTFSTRDTVDERWQTGHYAVYQGKFWKDRVQVVGGFRQDRYLVRVRNYDYFNGQRRTAPRGSLATDPAADQAAWNTGRWAAAAGLPGASTAANPLSAGYRFQGRAQEQGSPTLGVNVTLAKPVSLYVVSAGGLTPNPGQRDGRGQNFDAETSQSKEVGLKIDLMGGKISGTISFFEIDRQNAIYFASNAPAPRVNRTQPGATGFDPRLPRSFGVRKEVFNQVRAAAAATNTALASYLPTRPVTTFGQPAGVNTETAADIVINYETLGTANPLERAAIEAALTGKLANGQNVAPITGYTPGPFEAGRGGANWTGLSRGTDTAFGDNSRGFDAQLILSPKSNWQLTFNFANVVRKVTDPFKFVDFTDLSDDRNYGTEYDLWVYAFGGPSQFTDPKRASTSSNSLLLGKSLDDSPKNSFSILSNYTFESGPLKGLSVRPSVIWTAPRQTSVPIGGGNLAENALKTPDLPARTEYRIGFGYRRKIANRNWNFQVVVNNLLDDQKGETIAEYRDAIGGTVRRNAFVYYLPREIRFSTSTTF